jgi:hypothetical protein
MDQGRRDDVKEMHLTLVAPAKGHCVVRGSERELGEIRWAENPFQSNHGDLSLIRARRSFAKAAGPVAQPYDSDA